LLPKQNILQQEEEKTTKTGKTTIFSSIKKTRERTLPLSKTDLRFSLGVQTGILTHSSSKARIQTL